MNARDIVLIGALIDRCPPLLAVAQEHLDDYGELLPHVLMGELTRWAVGRYQVAPADPELTAALDLLEASFAAGQAADRELIGASFLENLPRPGESDADIRRLLGPALRGHLDTFG